MLRIVLSSLFMATFLQAPAINPEREYRFRPDAFGLSYEETKIATHDDHLLNTWVLEPESDSKSVTVIISGPDAGNMAYNLGRAKALVDLGYRVVTYDYRGFGDSTEFAFNRNNVYHQEYITDCSTIIDWCRTSFPSSQLAMYGLSMGTLISTCAYAKSPFDFFVGEAFVLSPVLIKQRVLKSKDRVLQIPQSWASDLQYRDQIDIPILLFAAQQDEITTTKDCEVFALGKRSEIVEFDGAHLMGVSVIGPEAYFRRIDEFLNYNHLDDE